MRFNTAFETCHAAGREQSRSAVRSGSIVAVRFPRLAIRLSLALLVAVRAGFPLPAGPVPGQSANSAADASPTVADMLGVNIHFTDPMPGELPMLAASGVRWVRMDLAWSATERVRGQYDFSAYDHLVAALEASHLKALFILDYANPLYDQNLSPSSDEGREAFASWAAAAVRHFTGHGLLWEIYNEPNAFWTPRPDTGAYIKLALATSEAIAIAAPEEKVVGPASAVIDPAFLEACFRAGLLNYWSAVTIHPYRHTDPETAAEELREVRLLIRKYSPPGKKIRVMAGEWGYSSVAPGMDEQKQGVMLAREWLLDLANNVPLSIWYDWRDGNEPHSTEAHFGLVGPLASSAAAAPNTPFRPKPAYLAARTLTQTLGDFQFSKRLALNSADDYALLFTKGDSMRLAVWTAASPHDAVLPASTGDFTVTGITGERLPSVHADRHGLQLTLTNAPQYLEPQPSNDLLLVAAAWQRLPLEIEVRAPGVLPLHLSLRNPLGKPERFELRAAGAPFETEGSVKAKAGEEANLVIRVAALERSVKAARLGVELEAGKVGTVGQETAIVASNPLRVTLLPATAHYLPVSIANPSRDPVRGALRVIGSGLQFNSRETPLRIAAGTAAATIKLPLASPPRTDYRAGIEILDEDGNRIYFLREGAFRLVGDFAGSPSSPAASSYSLLAEGGAKPGSLEWSAPPGGAPQPGLSALRIDYDLTGTGAGLRLVGKDQSGIPGQPTALGLWLYGDGSGVLPYLRFVDSSGQVFQEGGGPLDWKGWRYVLVFMDAPRGQHSGGANDGIIHYPIQWDSLFMIRNPAAQQVSGTLYLGGMVLTYGPAADSR
jgi:hypothetical protein